MALDIMVVPCISQVDFGDGSAIDDNSECVRDRDAIMEYVGRSFNLFAYYN